MAWRAENLAPDALGVSASRRTDIPALFGEWFLARLEAGFVESIPPGPVRRVRHSLRPEDVTHFTFWTKWPRPFFRALERVQRLGYPVLWNVTVTGLGGTPVEPGVPRPDRVIAAIRELSARVGPEAIVWRYDPLFVSAQYDPAWHRSRFRRLAEAFAGHVDRIAVSFVTPYRRQVLPDLRAYEAEIGDARDEERPVGLACELAGIADDVGIPFRVCGDAELRHTLGCARSDCNAFAWAQRAYPALARHTPSPPRPTRPDCGCSREVDIGVYDTCVLGCRYCYASRSRRVARERFARHVPQASGLVP